MLYLSVSTDAPSEPTEGNDLLLGDDVLQVGDCAVQVHLLDGLGGLAGVLKDTREKNDQSRGRWRFAEFHSASGQEWPPLNSKLLSPSFGVAAGKLRMEADLEKCEYKLDTKCFNYRCVKGLNNSSN